MSRNGSNRVKNGWYSLKTGGVCVEGGRKWVNLSENGLETCREWVFFYFLAGWYCLLGNCWGLGYVGLVKSTLITKWGAASEETAMGALTLLLL